MCVGVSCGVVRGVGREERGEGGERMGGETYCEHGAHEDGFDGWDGGVGIALVMGGGWSVTCLLEEK